MITSVVKLYRQSSSWETIAEHSFLNRSYSVSDSGDFFRNGLLVTGKPDGRGTITIGMTDDNNAHVRFKLHQIVLQTFNPLGYKSKSSVDHISRDRLDNSLSNLRYADYKTQFSNRENVKYKLKKVRCIETNAVYESCKLAEELMGLNKNTVARAARGQRKHSGGFTFKWE